MGKLSGDVPSHHKVVAATHPLDGLDDLIFVVRDDLDSLEVLEDGVSHGRRHLAAVLRVPHYSKLEAPLGHVGRVGLALLSAPGTEKHRTLALVRTSTV